MSLLDINLDDIKDLELLPEGEYVLEIIKAEVKENSKKTGNNIMVVCKVLDQDCENVFHYCILPAEGDDETKVNNKKRMLKAFCEAFGLDTGSIDTDTWVGASAWCALKVDTYQDQESNKIKRALRPA